MVLLSELSPGRNVGVLPSDVSDLKVAELMAERSGFATDVVGGFSGDVFVVDTLAETGPTSVRAALMDPDPLWIVPTVGGVVSLTSEIIIGSNKTLDCRAGILNFDGKRLNASDASELILCNFGVRYSDNDGITLRGSDMVWAHHLSLTSCSDGLLDISRAKDAAFGTARHTVSWCKFTNHNKCTLIGLHGTDAVNDAFIEATYHHNRMQCNQRQPRIAQGRMHAFNNVVLFDLMGMESYDHAHLLSERNWIEARSTSTVGMDYALPGFTNGRIKSVGNIFAGGAVGAEYGASGVFVPPYVYSAATMTTALRSEILSGAGATLTL